MPAFVIGSPRRAQQIVLALPEREMLERVEGFLCAEHLEE
jgi:hypothetical protein